MIMDRLERFRCYQRSVPELWDAVRFAERVQKEQLPPGKYPVGKGFAFVQEGNTRSFEEADFEVHRNYLDVQILLNGSEMWEYADRADLAVKTSYRKVVVKIKIDKLLHGVPAMERTAVYGKGDRRWI